MEQACTPDLTEERNVVRHMRDLINLSNLLLNGFEQEFNNFTSLLSKLGWDPVHIYRMQSYASTNTRFDFLTDYFGRRLVPAPIRERGDQSEWRSIKPRAKR